MRMMGIVRRQIQNFQQQETKIKPLLFERNPHEEKAYTYR
jgi:hypothetical protein